MSVNAQAELVLVCMCVCVSLQCCHPFGNDSRYAINYLLIVTLFALGHFHAQRNTVMQPQ